MKDVEDDEGLQLDSSVLLINPYCITELGFTPMEMWQARDRLWFEEDVVVKLSGHDSPYIRSALAANPLISAKLRRKLLDDNRPGVVAACLCNSKSTRADFRFAARRMQGKSYCLMIHESLFLHQHCTEVVRQWILANRPVLGEV